MGTYTDSSGAHRAVPRPPTSPWVILGIVALAVAAFCAGCWITAPPTQ